MTDAVARGYDAVYAAWRSSPSFHALWDRHTVDDRYPVGYEHISFLTFDELVIMASELNLDTHKRLLDVACGAGGPGLWVAEQRRAGLLGIDLSRVGLGAALHRAREHGKQHTLFAAATVTALPTATGCVDAAMSVDALQYVPSKREAFGEIHRVLHAGSRLVFTAFELDADRVAGLPVLGDDPVGDYAPVLEDAGFRVMRYETTPDWRQRLHDAYGAVLDAESRLVPEMGDAAFRALQGELAITLAVDPYRGRVLVVAAKT